MTSDNRVQKKPCYAGGYSTAFSPKQLAKAIIKSRGQSTSYETTINPMPVFHEPLPVKASILQRPLKARSQMTRENLDSQFELDSLKWSRKREAYQEAAKSPAHNHGPGILSLFERGLIASKGKGKGIPQSSYEPSLLVGVKSSDRPSSAPPERPPVGGSGKQQKHINPILQNEAQQEPQRQKISRPLSAFNPILGQYPPSQTHDLHAPLERPVTPGRRARVESGISWGSYNPLTHEWGHQPADPRYLDQEAIATRQWGINGRQKRQVTQGTNRDQGVYNPITNVWIVPPVNQRIVGGLHFHTPTTHFSPARP